MNFYYISDLGVLNEAFKDPKLRREFFEFKRESLDSFYQLKALMIIAILIIDVVMALVSDDPFYKDDLYKAIPMSIMFSSYFLVNKNLLLVHAYVLFTFIFILGGNFISINSSGIQQFICYYIVQMSAQYILQFTLFSWAVN
jgi:hypothetical protein